MQPEITGFFHEPTNTVSYVVADPETAACAVIDSVLDFDQDAGRTGTAHADRIVAHIRAHGLRLDWILETHVHADHLSAAPYLRDTLGGRIGIGAQITTVQHTFAVIYNAERGFARDGSQFDHLFADGETLRHRRARGRVPRHARPHAGLRLLQGRRQHLRRRHPVHARLRHGALRLPRRRRADHVPLDPPHPRLPPADRALDVPRLRRPGPRGLSPGAPPSAPSARRTRRSATASARTSSWRCARRATPRSARRSSSSPRSRSTCAPATCRRPRTTAPRYLKVPINVIGRKD